MKMWLLVREAPNPLFICQIFTKMAPRPPEKFILDICKEGPIPWLHFSGNILGETGNGTFFKSKRKMRLEQTVPSVSGAEAAS